LQRLREDYPNEELIGFFYDPNIHPYSEYYLRLLDVRRSCDMLGIELIEGEYDVDSWLNAVRGLENEPEKGKRCSVCFDRRFRVSAKMADSLKETFWTSTLLISPKKSIEQLRRVGEEISKEYGIEFISPDYRKNSGTQQQNILAKRDKLYRQNYCGCIFGLKIQRDEQKKLADELFVPISNQIQPDSIEERVELYKRRLELEAKGINYRIVRERFLNWRLESALLRVKKEIVPSHIIPYSTLKRDYTRGRIEYNIENIYYLNRDEVKFVSLELYNKITNCNYKNVMELIFTPPNFDTELNFRAKVIPNQYDISALIVVDKIPKQKIELHLKSYIYEDIREELIEL